VGECTKKLSHLQGRQYGKTCKKSGLYLECNGKLLKQFKHICISERVLKHGDDEIGRINVQKRTPV
jgi:hypothetical protein